MGENNKCLKSAYFRTCENDGIEISIKINEIFLKNKGKFCILWRK